MVNRKEFFHTKQTDIRSGNVGLGDRESNATLELSGRLNVDIWGVGGDFIPGPECCQSSIAVIVVSSRVFGRLARCEYYAGGDTLSDRQAHEMTLVEKSCFRNGMEVKSLLESAGRGKFPLQ